jgi:hypothetical protein
MKASCSNCGKDYNCYYGNTRIYGPVIETTCDNCGKEVIRNFSAFVHHQVDNDCGRLELVRREIALARKFSKKFAEDAPNKRKKKNEKKVS